MNTVVSCIDMIDMGPEKKPAFGQAGDGNTGMMERQQFFGAEIFLAIEKIAVGCAEREVNDSCPSIALYEHEDADPKEKDDLRQPEQEVHPGELSQDIPAGQHEDKDIERHEQQAPKIEGGRFFAAKMTDGVGQDECTGRQMQPTAGTFESLEGGVNDREGDRIHKRSLG